MPVSRPHGDPCPTDPSSLVGPLSPLRMCLPKAPAPCVPENTLALPTCFKGPCSGLSHASCPLQPLWSQGATLPHQDGPAMGAIHPVFPDLSDTGRQHFAFLTTQPRCTGCSPPAIGCSAGCVLASSPPGWPPPSGQGSAECLWPGHWSSQLQGS